ncbi:MAG TPA: hypothetical protein VK607_15480 [Kofleriaceae bacterium]|nr:hypothetical protein [Kofleriaceae bacterium]HMG53659.1 hypothetical protein [Kofleriaceae bacterium]
MKLLLVMVVILAAPASALGQAADSASAAKLPLARRLYDEGVDALNKGRWSIAYDRFKASYELAPRVNTLFNLAAAQSQTGRLVEASESYRKFLRDTDGRYADQRSDATAQLEQLEKQIAQITLEITSIAPDDVIVLDEIEFPHAALREAIPLNPGSHVARVQRGTSVVATRTMTLAAGAVETIQIDVPAKRVDLAVPRPADPPPATALTAAAPAETRTADRGSGGGGGWLRSPWLWSGVAVVIAGTATGAYFLTRPPDGLTVH